MRASLGVAAIAVISTWPVAAEAADLWTRPAYPPAPYAPVVSPWTGFYVGGFVGGTISDQKLDEHGANQFPSRKLVATGEQIRPCLAAAAIHRMTLHAASPLLVVEELASTRWVAVVPHREVAILPELPDRLRQGRWAWRLGAASR